MDKPTEKKNFNSIEQEFKDDLINLVKLRSPSNNERANLTRQIEVLKKDDPNYIKQVLPLVKQRSDKNNEISKITLKIESIKLIVQKIAMLKTDETNTDHKKNLIDAIDQLYIKALEELQTEIITTNLLSVKDKQCGINVMCSDVIHKINTDLQDQKFNDKGLDQLKIEITKYVGAIQKALITGGYKPVQQDLLYW